MKTPQKATHERLVQAGIKIQFFDNFFFVWKEDNNSAANQVRSCASSKDVRDICGRQYGARAHFPFAGCHSVWSCRSHSDWLRWTCFGRMAGKELQKKKSPAILANKWKTATGSIKVGRFLDAQLAPLVPASKDNFNQINFMWRLVWWTDDPYLSQRLASHQTVKSIPSFITNHLNVFLHSRSTGPSNRRLIDVFSVLYTYNMRSKAWCAVWEVTSRAR